MAFQEEVADKRQNISRNPQKSQSTASQQRYRQDNAMEVFLSQKLHSSMWLKNVTNELAFRYISLKLKSEHVDVPPIFVPLFFLQNYLPVSSLDI